MSVENDRLHGFQVINTKISLWSYDRLMRLLKKKKLNFYQFVQNICDCFIRNMDDKHNLTPETEKVMATFEHAIGWEDNFNLADPKAKPEIAEATYYMTEKTGKRGVRVMHVEKPFFGQWTQNFNIQQIMERFMCLTFPTLYKRLRFIAVCRECSSIFELLVDLAGELEAEEQKKELNEPFEDAARGDFGQHFPSTPKKRTHEKSDDTIFKEGLI